MIDPPERLFREEKIAICLGIDFSVYRRRPRQTGRFNSIRVMVILAEELVRGETNEQNTGEDNVHVSVDEHVYLRIYVYMYINYYELSM